MVSRRHYEDVCVEGHLIDSQIVSKVMDDIIELGGEFETLSFQVGRTNDDTSRAIIRVIAPDALTLDRIITGIQERGAVPLDTFDAELAPAPADGVFPEAFYSTTNMDTAIRLDGRWLHVEGTEMDLGIVVDPEALEPRTVPMSDVKAGELYVVGHQGLRITPPERPRERHAFEFMGSPVSSEKPKAQMVAEVAELLRETRAQGKRTIAVVGPAVVHTGAVGHLARLFETGYLGVLFGGNAVAVHDVERSIFGTSLGVRLDTGKPVPGGHEHHLRAINRIRAAGSLEKAVEDGVLTEGLMYTLVKTRTPYVLAGSVRDDGPMPGVIEDMMEAQRVMREHCRRAGACLMMSSMLHSIATGNMLPASTPTVCVDINPAVVTKLADRGSFQTIGVVTDVGLFLEMLADELAGRRLRK